MLKNLVVQGNPREIIVIDNQSTDEGSLELIIKSDVECDVRTESYNKDIYNNLKGKFLLAAELLKVKLSNQYGVSLNVIFFIEKNL